VNLRFFIPLTLFIALAGPALGSESELPDPDTVKGPNLDGVLVKALINGDITKIRFLIGEIQSSMPGDFSAEDDVIAGSFEYWRNVADQEIKELGRWFRLWWRFKSGEKLNEEETVDMSTHINAYEQS